MEYEFVGDQQIIYLLLGYWGDLNISGGLNPAFYRLLV